MKKIKPVTLLFDLTATQPSQGKFHGAGEYAKAVYIHLIKIRTSEVLCGVYNPGEWLDPDIKKITDEHKIELLPAKNIKEIEMIVENRNFDRFYTALSYDYFNADFKSADFVYTIHGLRDIEMPTDRYEFLYRRNIDTLMKWFIKNIFPSFYENLIKGRIEKLLKKNIGKNQIIADSLHTKYSLINTYSYLEKNSIRVLYPPEKHIHKSSEKINPADILKKFRVTGGKYILMISGNRWIKNAYRGIRAMDSIYSDHKNIEHKTLIVGGSSLRSIFLKLKNPGMFIFTDYVENNELEILYKNSSIFLYPTLNEGFGYPPLEAMKYGIPSACSAISSVTEICGDAVIYFNPFRIDEIMNRILMLLNDKEIYSSYSKKSLMKSREISSIQRRMLDELCIMLLKKQQ